MSPGKFFLLNPRTVLIETIRSLLHPGTLAVGTNHKHGYRVYLSALSRRVDLLSGSRPLLYSSGGLLPVSKATALGRTTLKYTKILYSPIKTSKRKGIKPPPGGLRQGPGSIKYSQPFKGNLEAKLNIFSCLPL